MCNERLASDLQKNRDGAPRGRRKMSLTVGERRSDYGENNSGLKEF